MDAVCTDFDERVSGIAGLTSYRPHQLPAWFRERLRPLKKPNDALTDAQLVERRFGRIGVGGWGTAVVDGEDVFACEMYGADWRADHLCRSEIMKCDLHYVDASGGNALGTVMYFSDRLAKRARRK